MLINETIKHSFFSLWVSTENNKNELEWKLTKKVLRCFFSQIRREKWNTIKIIDRVLELRVIIIISWPPSSTFEFCKCKYAYAIPFISLADLCQTCVCKQCNRTPFYHSHLMQRILDWYTFMSRPKTISISFRACHCCLYELINFPFCVCSIVERHASRHSLLYVSEI